MMYMILFVLHDPDKLKPVLDSWTNAGVSGITVFPSTGIGRLTSDEMLLEDVPLIPSLDDLFQVHERTNRTLFTIVKGDEMVDRVVKATEEVIGDLDDPNTGILTVIPVVKTYGLNRKDPNEDSDR